MPECDHCGERFDDEDAYLRHLGDEHEGDLGRIERRRVANAVGDESSGIPVGPAVLLGVVGFAVILVVYLAFFFGGGGDAGPRHAHGEANVTILGDRIDFSQPQYQMQADFFHFEPGPDGEPNGRIWHTHERGVTLAEAMETLGIGLEDGAVTFEGTTYRDSDPNYDVVIEVDGEPVDPTSHTLVGVADPTNAAQGDSVHIVVRQTDGAS